MDEHERRALPRRRWARHCALALLLAARLAPCAAGASDWVDPDTPEDKRSRVIDGVKYELVMSDEFEVAGRTFDDGHDSIWTAIVGSPTTNEQVNDYNPANVYTEGGKLVIETTVEALGSTAPRPYQTAMIQSWDKFCFTEGFVEVSAQLPGRSTQEGLWPAFWMFGNLGRAAYPDTTNRLWPFITDSCPAPEHARANQKGTWELDSCDGQQARGAPEIDIIEAMPGTYVYDFADKVRSGACPPVEQSWIDRTRVSLPMVAQSLQAAPGLPHDAVERPILGCMPNADGRREHSYYPELWPTAQNYGPIYADGINITLNYEFYGDAFSSPAAAQPNGEPMHTDAFSALYSLQSTHWDAQHAYQCEWVGGDQGRVRFSIDDEFRFNVPASVVAAERRVTFADAEGEQIMDGRKIPDEPMYLILNVDLSPKWGWNFCDPDECDCCTDCRRTECTTCMQRDAASGELVNTRQWLAELCEMLPSKYEVEYVRVYQREGATNLGCDTAERPTTEYIRSRRERYTDDGTADAEPLQPVRPGGAPCGEGAGRCSPHGRCVDGSAGPDGGLPPRARCVCDEGWTGPRCRSRALGAARTCAQLSAGSMDLPPPLGGALSANGTGDGGDGAEASAAWSAEAVRAQVEADTQCVVLAEHGVLQVESVLSQLCARANGTAAEAACASVLRARGEFWACSVRQRANHVLRVWAEEVSGGTECCHLLLADGSLRCRTIGPPPWPLLAAACALALCALACIGPFALKRARAAAAARRARKAAPPRRSSSRGARRGSTLGRRFSATQRLRAVVAPAITLISEEDEQEEAHGAHGSAGGGGVGGGGGDDSRDSRSSGASSGGAADGAAARAQLVSESACLAVAPRASISNAGVQLLLELFEHYARVFGFQTASVQAQYFHLLQLWAAQTAALGDERAAAAMLHSIMFASFERWLEVASGLLSFERLAGRQDTMMRGKPSHAQRLHEMALYLCLWSEAGNVRFVPEALCFFFECARNHAADKPAPASTPGDRLNWAAEDSSAAAISAPAPLARAEPGASGAPSPPPLVSEGDYLRRYVQPLYDFIFSRSFKGLDARGRPAEHPWGKAESKAGTRENYDDWNEVFWTPTHVGRIVTKEGRRILDLPMRERWSALAAVDWEASMKGCKRHFERLAWYGLFVSYARIFSFHAALFALSLFALHWLGLWHGEIGAANVGTRGPTTELGLHATLLLPAAVQLAADLAKLGVKPRATFVGTLLEPEKSAPLLLQLALFGLAAWLRESLALRWLYLVVSTVVAARAAVGVRHLVRKMPHFDSHVRRAGVETARQMAIFWGVVLGTKLAAETLVSNRAGAIASARLDALFPLWPLMEEPALAWHLRASPIFALRAVHGALVWGCTIGAHYTSTYYWYVLGVAVYGTVRGLLLLRGESQAGGHSAYHGRGSRLGAGGDEIGYAEVSTDEAKPSAVAAAATADAADADADNEPEVPRVRALCDIPAAFVAQVFASDSVEQRAVRLGLPPPVGATAGADGGAAAELGAARAAARPAARLEPAPAPRLPFGRERAQASARLPPGVERRWADVWHEICLDMHNNDLISSAELAKLKYGGVEHEEAELVPPAIFRAAPRREADVLPRSKEAQRRIQTLRQSLCMKMPRPAAVEALPSFTVLIPHYGETIVTSEKELLEPPAGGNGETTGPLISMLMEYSTDELNNMRARIGEQEWRLTWAIITERLASKGQKAAAKQVAGLAAVARRHLRGLQKELHKRSSGHRRATAGTSAASAAAESRDASAELAEPAAPTIRASTAARVAEALGGAAQAMEATGEAEDDEQSDAGSSIHWSDEDEGEGEALDEELWDGLLDDSDPEEGGGAGGANAGLSQVLVPLRKWASMRSQSLYRTVRGMMAYSRALDVLLRVQRPDLSAEAREELVATKFSCVVSMQRYADFSPEELEGAELMLKEFPRLKIAYIDTEPEPGGTLGKRFYSCLVDGMGKPSADGKRTPRYRVQLPGHPILGDGKGDNQNHALIFSKGRFLQTIDSNQEGYLEEALKICNALAEFDAAQPAGGGVAAGGGGTMPWRVAIVGFREHIYSTESGAVAHFAGSSELVFGTITQRTMDKPLLSRQYYGHPDIMEKMTMMAQGGVSKATKGLNLSEDVFAGMDLMLRGGAVVHREYMQVGKGREMTFVGHLMFVAKLARGCAQVTLTRQSYRLGTRLRFLRLLGFYYGHVGHYFTPLMLEYMMWAYAFLFLFFCASDVPSGSAAAGAAFGPAGGGTGVYSNIAKAVLDSQFGALAVMFLAVQTLPLLLQLWLAHGLLRALAQLLGQLLSCSLLFYGFQNQVTGQSFRGEISVGGAAYIPTGRSMAAARNALPTLFRAFAQQTMRPATDILVMISLALLTRPASLPAPMYWVEIGLAISSFLYAPFIFNPRHFAPRSIARDDLGGAARWLLSDAADGWRPWHLSELSALGARSPARFVACSRRALGSLALGLLAMAVMAPDSSRREAAWTALEFFLATTPAAPLLLASPVAALGFALSRCASGSPKALRAARALSSIAVALALGAAHAGEVCAHAWYGSTAQALEGRWRAGAWPTPRSQPLTVPQLAVIGAAKYMGVHACTSGVAVLAAVLGGRAKNAAAKAKAAQKARKDGQPTPPPPAAAATTEQAAAAALAPPTAAAPAAAPAASSASGTPPLGSRGGSGTPPLVASPPLLGARLGVGGAEIDSGADADGGLGTVEEERGSRTSGNSRASNTSMPHSEPHSSGRLEGSSSMLLLPPGATPVRKPKKALGGDGAPAAAAAPGASSDATPGAAADGHSPSHLAPSGGPPRLDVSSLEPTPSEASSARSSRSNASFISIANSWRGLTPRVEPGRRAARADAADGGAAGGKEKAKKAAATSLGEAVPAALRDALLELLLGYRLLADLFITLLIALPSLALALLPGCKALHTYMLLRVRPSENYESKVQDITKAQRWSFARASAADGGSPTRRTGRRSARPSTMSRLFGGAGELGARAARLSTMIGGRLSMWGGDGDAESDEDSGRHESTRASQANGRLSVFGRGGGFRGSTRGSTSDGSSAAATPSGASRSRYSSRFSSRMLSSRASTTTPSGVPRFPGRSDTPDDETTPGGVPRFPARRKGSRDGGGSRVSVSARVSSAGGPMGGSSTTTPGGVPRFPYRPNRPSDKVRGPLGLCRGRPEWASAGGEPAGARRSVSDRMRKPCGASGSCAAALSGQQQQQQPGEGRVSEVRGEQSPSKSTTPSARKARVSWLSNLGGGPTMPPREPPPPPAQPPQPPQPPQREPARQPPPPPAQPPQPPQGETAPPPEQPPQWKQGETVRLTLPLFAAGLARQPQTQPQRMQLPQPGAGAAGAAPPPPQQPPQPPPLPPRPGSSGGPPKQLPPIAFPGASAAACTDLEPPPALPTPTPPGPSPPWQTNRVQPQGGASAEGLAPSAATVASKAKAFKPPVARYSPLYKLRNRTSLPRDTKNLSGASVSGASVSTIALSDEES